MTKEKELWKPIEGFEDRYEVSNLGRVKSLAFDYWMQPIGRRGHYRHKKECILKNTKQCIDGQVYCVVSLSAGQKQYTRFTVANLVAQHFVPNPNNWYFVEHIDGDYDNNRADNLRWKKYEVSGVQRSTEAASKPVRCIETGKVYSSVREASRLTGFHKNSITWNARGVQGYSHCCGYHFEYVDKEAS